MSRSPGRQALAKRIGRWAWVCAAFFAIGYVPTMIWRNPVISMVVAAAAVIPVGGKCSTVLQGAVRGMLLGLIAGFSAFGTLLMTYQASAAPATQPATLPATAQTAPAAASAPAAATSTQPQQRPRELTSGEVNRLGLVCIGGTVFLCAIISAAFAQAARTRRVRIEEHWRR